MTGGCDGKQRLASVLTRLIALPDAAVFEVAAVVCVRLFDADQHALTGHQSATAATLTLLPQKVRTATRLVNDDF